MTLDFPAFLDLLREGVLQEDAAALLDVLPNELPALLAEVPDAERKIAKAEAEFRRSMTRVLVDVAQVRQSVTAARALLARKDAGKQMTLSFNPGEGFSLDMPGNGRQST